MRFATIATLLALSVAGTARADQGDLAYFRQFLLRKIVDNTDPDFPKTTYRYLMASGIKEGFKSDKGTNVHVMSSLYLYEDGSYEVFHTEMEDSGPPTSDGSQPMFPLGCKHWKGKWAVPGKQLEADGLGNGDRWFEDNQNMVKLTYTKDVIAAGLKGYSQVFAYGFSQSEPGSEFCF